MQLPGRNLSLLCLFMVLAVAIGGGVYVRGNVSENLVFAPAREAAGKVAGSFSRAVWQPKTLGMARPLCQVAGSENCPDLASIRAQGLSFFSLLPLVAINIYSNEGQLLLTIGGSFPEREVLEKGVPYFLEARRGTEAVQQLSGVDFNAYQGGLIEGGSVLRLFQPMGTEVVEVVVDITDKAALPRQLQLVTTLLVLGLFGALYMLLSLNASKAEEIISTQHEEQADLIAAKTKAEAESVEKSKFLANVSHELRTPLNSIIGFSEILKDEVMGAHQVPQYKEYATDIYISGTHLLSLINDILDFSKADAGKLEVQLSDVDVTKLMLSCLRVVSPKAESAQVQLVPEMVGEQHVVCRTDPKRLKQVVLNLLSNSVKFTPPGGVITLSCKLQEIEGNIHISVRDTGVGIAEKDISKVMAPFGQVENEYSSKSDGTGLGLPLTKRLVELMGGRFQIESSLGKGTAVTLILPYKPASEAPEGSGPV